MGKWFQDKTEKTYMEKLREEMLARSETQRKKLEAHKYEMERIRMAQEQAKYMAQAAQNHQNVAQNQLIACAGTQATWGNTITTANYPVQSGLTGIANYPLTTGVTGYPTTGVIYPISGLGQQGAAINQQYVPGYTGPYNYNPIPPAPKPQVMDPPFSLDELEAAQDFIDALPS